MSGRLPNKRGGKQDLIKEFREIADAIESGEAVFVTSAAVIYDPENPKGKPITSIRIGGIVPEGSTPKAAALKCIGALIDQANKSFDLGDVVTSVLKNAKPKGGNGGQLPGDTGIGGKIITGGFNADKETE